MAIFRCLTRVFVVVLTLIACLTRGFQLNRPTHWNSRLTTVRNRQIETSYARVPQIFSNASPFALNSNSNSVCLQPSENGSKLTLHNRLNLLIRSINIRSILMGLAGFVSLILRSPVAAFARDAVSSTTKQGRTGGSKTSFFKKVLEGANVSGSFKNWQVGDTRTEFAALLNSISGLLILGGLGFLAWLAHQQREFRMNMAMRGELQKITEYKENMYFEAVQDILNKLADPKTKGSTKANLTSELRGLDPEGVIQAFLKQGGERPDISHMINKKNNKKKPSKKAPKRGGGGSDKNSASSSMKRKAVSDDSDYRDDDNEEAEEELRRKNRRNEEKEEEEAEAEENEKRENARERERMNRNLDERTSSTPKKSISNSFKSTPAPIEPPPTPKAKSNTDVLFTELDDSLQQVLTAQQRSTLISYLKRRLQGIADPAKRENALDKIAERLGDKAYWIEYAKKLEG